MKTLKRSVKYIPVGSTMELGNITYMLVCVSRSPIYGLEFHFEDMKNSDRKKVFYQDELQHLVVRGIEFTIFFDEYQYLQDVVKGLSEMDNTGDIIPLVEKSIEVLRCLG